ncbi:hypothetical protein [Marimonas lutisalis]|uniref:hypothetical protein n=1 Tax=Marimonas lutisalis TaxID=2545756 RepID=UPI0010F7F97E|nr:hypothetical protein [Marimonas lutisalis]
MALFLAYVTVFIAGPAVFLGLTRAAPSRHRVMMGAASVAGLMAAAWILKGVQQVDVIILAWLTCAWLGWVVTIATVVQAVRLRMGLTGVRKWSAALGAAATAAPWFGLSLALGT